MDQKVECERVRVHCPRLFLHLGLRHPESLFAAIHCSAQRTATNVHHHHLLRHRLHHRPTHEMTRLVTLLSVGWPIVPKLVTV